MKKHLLCLSVAALLAACGSGSSSGGGSAISFSGKIIDGYIENAIVCIDLNSSLTCDDGEPSAITKADGSYSLDYKGANPVGLPILAVVTANSKDEDDNGKTLAEVGKEPFNLASPIASTQTTTVHVTPLTTMVMHSVLSDSTNAVTADSIDAARQQVQRQLGTSKDVLTLNYKQDADEDLHKVAQVISVVLGDMAKQSKGTDKSSQVEIGAAIQNNILPSIVKDGKLDSTVAATLGGADKTKIVANLKTELENKAGYSTVVTGTIANIDYKSKLPGQVTASAATIFQNGLVILESKRFHPASGNAFPNDMLNYTDGKFLRANYIQFSSDQSTFKELKRYWYKYAGATSFDWASSADWGTDHALASDGTWVPDQDFIQSGLTPTVTDNCIEVPHSKGVVSSQKICMTKLPLDGQLITKFIPDICKTKSEMGFAPIASCSTEQFPTGSFGLNIVATELKDYYQISVPRHTADQSETYWCNGQTASDIDSLVTLMVGSNGNLSDCRIWLWNDFSVKLTSYASGKGELKWGRYNHSTYQYENEETGSFSVVTVNNNKILVIPPSQSYHKENPGDMTGQDFIISKVAGKIYNGSVTYANTKQAINFGAANAIGNSLMADAILKAIGVGKIPYDKAQTPSASTP